MKKFAPLLAEKTQIENVVFPVYASAKLDGIRCLIKDNVPVSRKLLGIPNAMITAALSDPALNGLDGELIAGSPTSVSCFNTTTRLVGKQEAVSDDWRYYVFDDATYPEDRFFCRTKDAENKVEAFNNPHVVLLPQCLIEDRETLLAFEEMAVGIGYEGVMIRSLDGPYKFGRSTEKEGTLLKLKRFVDTEVEILEVHESMSNQNEATKDALGHTKRSTAKAGKVLRGRVGGYTVREISGEFAGRTFKCSGGSEAENKALWLIKDSLIGKIGTVKYQAVGVLNKPRFPTWKGFRESFDIGEPDAV